MAKALTAKALTAYKADPGKRREIPDGVVTGLYFVIQPSGRQSWAVRYRAHGKPKKIVLGPYMGGDDLKRAGDELKRIRGEAAEILDRARQGEDPSIERQIAKRASRDQSEADRLRFESVTRTFLARHAKPQNRSWKETARTLGLVPDKARPETADDPHEFVAVKGGTTGLSHEHNAAIEQGGEFVGDFARFREAVAEGFTTPSGNARFGILAPGVEGLEITT